MPKSNIRKVKVHPDEVEFFKTNSFFMAYIDEQGFARAINADTGNVPPKYGLIENHGVDDNDEVLIKFLSHLPLSR